ncbi:hypothetical protein [Actinoplanes utahensis]|uniref:GNAT family N-acetyltransferase n=1 Tax=Actinoplanes utahensis TaxID=1869 RepID=A0A0A6UF01_ACTUT|nr:hypothetical protein [Actinoplanes utahensis]KHD74620.1 hypothetical protein MB27_27905 [Actinoplanes utahensis]GIF27727.1 hypothetical protein Aut01nite_07130 [Actinoplanes utahensis]
MRVEVMSELPADLLDEAWDFYSNCFNDLRVLAVNRHLMYRHEFDEVMADQRIDKHVALDDDGVAGMGTITNDLEAVPLVSADYFQYHWPELYEQRRLFYCLFAGSAVGRRSRGVFVALQRSMYAPIEEVDGKVFFDICSWNEERNQLPRMIAMILGRAASSGRAQPTRLDAQSFWMYEFPKDDMPFRRDERRGLPTRLNDQEERRAARL